MQLHEITSSIATALRDAAWRPAKVPVFEDDGTTGNSQDEAISTSGACLVVSPCLAARISSSTHSALKLTSAFIVHLRTSPRVNLSPTGAGINPQETVAPLLRTVTSVGRVAATGENRITPTTDFLSTPEDSGLFTYSLTFEVTLKVSL